MMPLADLNWPISVRNVEDFAVHAVLLERVFNSPNSLSLSVS